MTRAALPKSKPSEEPVERNFYNAKGSEVSKETKEEKEDFKHGGRHHKSRHHHKKRKTGGRRRGGAANLGDETVSDRGHAEGQGPLKGHPSHAEAPAPKSRKKGGKKRKRGGHAHGEKPHHRADKRARGGHSPFTKASKLEGRPGGHYDGAPTSKEDD